MRDRHLNSEDEEHVQQNDASSVVDLKAALWQHNAWDDLQWTPAMEAQAESIIQAQQHQQKQKEKDIIKEPLEEGREWDKFYCTHDRWFFKDRKWLAAEFPELFPPSSDNGGRSLQILEIGCGAGNTIWPLLRQNRTAKVWACDFSEKAVELVRTHAEFDPARVHIFQHDISSPEAALSIPDGSIDICIAVFVLSALDPHSGLPIALEKIRRVLKRPNDGSGDSRGKCRGGLLLFRDYARMDLTQLRFPPSRFLYPPDTYRRGDGTLVHYFTEDAIRMVFAPPAWDIADLHTDRRLIVNRKRQLMMRRMWIQGKFYRLF